MRNVFEFIRLNQIKAKTLTKRKMENKDNHKISTFNTGLCHFESNMNKTEKKMYVSEKGNEVETNIWIDFLCQRRVETVAKYIQCKCV